MEWLFRTLKAGGFKLEDINLTLRDHLECLLRRPLLTSVCWRGCWEKAYRDDLIVGPEASSHLGREPWADGAAERPIPTTVTCCP